jgi:hypothetical protein
MAEKQVNGRNKRAEVSIIAAFLNSPADKNLELLALTSIIC